MKFELKKTYAFSILNDLTPLLGEKYTLMKVKGILTSEEAVKYEDIYTTHTQALGFMSDMPNDVRELSFILLEKPSKETFILAYNYIDESSIKAIEAMDIRIEIRQANTEDLTLLNNLLKEAGYYDFSIKVIKV